MVLLRGEVEVRVLQIKYSGLLIAFVMSTPVSVESLSCWKAVEAQRWSLHLVVKMLVQFQLGGGLFFCFVSSHPLSP